MNATAKGKVAVLASSDIEPIGISKLGWVSIGGSKEEMNLLSRLNGLVAYLNVLNCYSGNLLWWAIIPQQFLHSALDDSWFLF
jgi:hypothetical protein